MEEKVVAERYEEYRKVLEGCQYKIPGISRETFCFLNDERDFERITHDAIFFNDLMTRYNGNPVGVELKHRTFARWAFVCDDASAPGHVRIQDFDEHGLIGHRSRATVEVAVNEMVREGFAVPDQGAFDRIFRARFSANLPFG